MHVVPLCLTSDLRSQVFWCSTERLHGGSVGDAFFAQAEVGDLDVTVFVQHEVLQLMRRTSGINETSLTSYMFEVKTLGVVYLQIAINDLGRM